MPKSSKDTGASEKTYAVGDVVLAKVKGYPAWPGHIINNDEAPSGVRKERPPKSKGQYLVQFFPTGDYTWAYSRDISTLAPREIEAYLTSGSKKKGDLLDGYQIAQDPTAWVRERREALERAAQMDTEDMLASGDEGGGGAALTGNDSKKRKRKSEASGGAGAAAAGTASKKETPEDKKAKKAKLEKLAKSRTAGGKKPPSEDEAAPPAKKSKSAVQEGDDAGMIQVKDWRHKLQKVFLGKTGVLTDELTKCKEYFDVMEKFAMTKEYLAESKLAKVMKRIASLNDADLPNKDEHNFKKRALDLAQLWSQQLGDAKAATPVPAETNGSEAPAPAASTSEEKPPANQESAPKADVADVAAPIPAPVGAEKKVEEQVPAAPAPEPTPASAEPTAMEVDAPVTTNGGEAKVEEKKEEPAPAPAPVESAPESVPAATALP
ncbi:hypothetical protein T439DRAFT_358184 [Meredithblackwellia eburnea MCA 4105]